MVLTFGLVTWVGKLVNRNVCLRLLIESDFKYSYFGISRIACVIICE